MSAPKESVFYPCGHRTACYQCTLEAFNKYKNCPICHTKAEGIIKKVYDV